MKFWHHHFTPDYEMFTLKSKLTKINVRPLPLYLPRFYKGILEDADKCQFTILRIN